MISYKKCRAYAESLGDRNYCVPLAFAVARQMPPAAVWHLHAKIRRRTGRCSHADYRKLWRLHGLRLGVSLRGRPNTLSEIYDDARLCLGVWIVATRTHVLCVRNGVIQDSPDTILRDGFIVSVRPVLQ